MTGGLVLFFGAIWMHQQGQERGLYSYNSPSEEQVRLQGHGLYITLRRRQQLRSPDTGRIKAGELMLLVYTPPERF
jgi:hypothetical protein